MSDYLSLGGGVYLHPDSGLQITDVGGPGTPLTVQSGGRTVTVPMPRADALRARLGYIDAVLPPLDYTNPTVIAAGHEKWSPRRPEMET